MVPTVSDLTVAANFPYKYVGMPVVTQDSGDMYILIGNDVTDESNWKKIGSGGGLTQIVRYNIVTKSVGNYDASITVNKYVDDELESSTDYLYSSLQTAVVIDHRIQLQYYSMNYHLTLLADSTTEQAGYTTQWAYNATVDLDQSFISEAYKPYVVEGYFNQNNNLFYEDSQYTTAISGKIETVYVTLNTNKSYRYDITNQIFVRLDEEPGINYTPGDGITIMSNEISTDNMPAEDMSEIVTPLPGVMSRRVKYSTSEQIIGEWINGKPIYQKTINFGALPNATIKDVAHGITNIDNIIDVFGIAEGEINSTKYSFHLPSVGVHPSLAEEAVKYNMALTIIGANIRIQTGIDRSSFSAYVTIRYTKTTDTAS